jgi:hypothetical protein
MKTTSAFKSKLLLSLLALTLSVGIADAADDDGFKSLFNGKDLTGWDGNPKLWSVKDGAIVGQTTKENPIKGNTFLILKDATYKDFELRAICKLEGNNSGIQYRSKVADPANWVVGGYQCDINSGPDNMCKLYQERMRGRIGMPGEIVTMDEAGKKNVTGASPDAEKLKTAEKKGDWNEITIIARGNHLIQKLNGLVAVDLTDNDAKGRTMDGIIALQIHAGEPMTISFKEIKIKELPPEK